MKEKYIWLMLSLCSAFCFIIFGISIYLENTNKYNWIGLIAWFFCGIVSFLNYKETKNDDF